MPRGSMTDPSLSPSLERPLFSTRPERWVSYEDMAFEQPTADASADGLEVVDLDRIIAWAFALAAEPDAGAPARDEILRANGYPRYPVLGYRARALRRGRMGLSLRYGGSDPQCGSGVLQGRFYLREAGGC